MKTLLLLALLSFIGQALVAPPAATLPRHRRPGSPAYRSLLQGKEEHQSTTFQTKYGFPGANNCTFTWFPQYIDHFNWGTPEGSPNGETMYNQRVLTYDKYYKPGGPIFFYAGNEAPITVFADIAGLMWQNAEEFNALIVFAEHRFFGSSQPCGGIQACFPYMSTQQAMADYAVLLTNLTKGQYKDSVGVITFGGSYGGMLSGYMRMKYPNLITGSIASSGPVTMVSSSYYRPSYYNVITNTAKKAHAMCPIGVQKALEAMFYLAETKQYSTLENLIKPCTPVASWTEGTVKDLLGWMVQGAFTSFAMGDYPVSLNFIFGTLDHPAPAWPMNVACNLMVKDDVTTADNNTLIQNLVAAMNVVNNVTQDQTCTEYNVNQFDSGNWDYMVCSEEMPDSIPYFWTTGAPNDMFWNEQPFTREMTDAHCRGKYGITTRWGWLNTTFGAGNVGGATNIVWANGLLDPWSSGGILNNVSDTVKAYHVPQGGHHVDLLFKVPGHDAEGLNFVHSEELRHIRKWLSDEQERRRRLASQH